MRIATSGVLMLLLTAGALGQGAAGTGPGAATPGAAVKLPAWDVISVKPATSTCTQGSGIMLTPDGIHVFCVPLLFVVEMGWDITEASRILDAPDWVKSGARWDIDAKVAGEDAAAFGKLNRSERALMLQALLVERFHLKAHMEQREMPVYDLVAAKGGAKLKEATAEESGKSRMIGGRGGKIEAVDATMDGLPWLLNNEVGRPVVNKTGLTGKYDFTLQYVPAAKAATDETGGPSVFTALEEQLGLKLEPAKEKMDVLVIDSIERPMAN